MKKLTAIACFSTLLLPLVAEAGWEENWLLGVSGAYNWHDGDIDISVNTIGTVPPLTFALENNFEPSDSSWGILGGYQAKCNGWLIGAELNVEWENQNQSQNYNYALPTGNALADAINATVNYKHDATIGLTGRLGYAVTCWLMPYARIGVETSRETMDIAMTDATGFITYVANASARSYRLLAGVGAEIPVFSSLVFRAEYNYHSRGNFLNTSNSWIDTGVLTNNFSTTSYYNHTNTVKAAFVYNFC